MTVTAIDVHSKAVKEKNNDVEVSDMKVSPRQITLGDILSRYGDIIPESLNRLSSVKIKSLALSRNQKIYSSCAEKAEIFVVRKGWVSLCHSIKARGQDICNVYMPGDIVGIRESFFDNHEISILALQNCELDKITAEEIHTLFTECADIKKAVVSYIMVNDNITIERLRSCTHHKAEARVAHFLLEVYARYRFNKMIDSTVFSFPVTQEIVGELLGITNVHVSRCMTALEQKKLIRKSRNTVNLLEPELLAEITGFDLDLIYSHVSLA
ncbi:Crp/Fnr family transcriptional regulator [Halomonas sp. SpR1]|uniref:Crp/Fnr family transcriptional regulator n=1 Tax=Halomonas sp. SpR1 TaxID=3050462 RepID=UPI0027E51C21|nr:Crp/Fnr family transcriptional regulator [Halomonas sp. SpR1]MDQ7733547.1 Crp/Fnr family transcriptional regulator [Halomonas sp. SpR1]